MKTIILTVTLLASSSFAKEIEQPSAKSIKNASTTYEQLFELRDYDAGPERPRTISYKLKDGQTTEKAIRHYIWRNYTGWSKPDGVDTQIVERTKRQYNSAAQSSIYYLEGSKANKLIKEFAKKVVNLLRWDSIEVYYLSHGNSFGGCGGIAIVDKYYSEFTIYQSCYGE